MPRLLYHRGMMDPEPAELDIGPYLKELRGDRSLRQVARGSGDFRETILAKLSCRQRNDPVYIAHLFVRYFRISVRPSFEEIIKVLEEAGIASVLGQNRATLPSGPSHRTDANSGPSW